MPLCINWFFIAILSQTSNLPQSEVFVNDWEWIEGTRWVGSVLAFDNQQNIIVKPSKGKTVDKGINGVGNQTVFSDTEIVGGSFKKVNDLSNDFKANQARLDLYEILKTIFKNSTMPPWGPKGITGGWGKYPFKKNIAYGNICAGVRRHGNIIKEVPPDDLYYYKNSEIKIDLNYLKIVENGHGFEMTGSCSYKIEIVENLKVTKKYEEKDVPVKFIASRRPAQPNPMVFSPQTLAELEDIRKKCNDSNINNKPSEDILSPIENKTSLVLNGKEITFDIRRGGSSHTIIGNNPYINLPSKGWVDWFTGYQDAMSRAANELGNIILDGLDGKLDGNCMSPDGRRISQLEAEALSDKFSSDLMKYYLDPVKNSYPFSKYLPNDPQKRQAILDICPINKPYRLLNDTGVYNKENDFYLKRNKLLNEANELVKQGKIKEAYGKLIKTVYGCKVIDAAEFFANNQTPEPPK
jgi:hypothetical protein